MNVAAVNQLNSGPRTGVWYRAVRHNHFATALHYAHSTAYPTRFNSAAGGRAGFGVLYFAQNQHVCLLEVGALLGAGTSGRPLVANPATPPWTVFSVQVVLQHVVDLCGQAELHAVSASVQEMTGDWRGYAVRDVAGLTTSPTQDLGAALHRRKGVEGFVTYSAQDATA